MKSILILRVHGLQVSKSFKIKYNHNLNLYLYPKDYFERLIRINAFLEKLESCTEDRDSLIIPKCLKFEIGNDRVTYIITKIAIMIIKNITRELFSKGIII